jgi:hypothetical protein
MKKTRILILLIYALGLGAGFKDRYAKSPRATANDGVDRRRTDAQPGGRRGRAQRKPRPLLDAQSGST